MATQIQCPECETRYEVKAAFPPEGRKVRCSKCSHVWQAKPVGAGTTAPQAPAAQPPAPPAPTPEAPPPQATPAPPPAPEPAPPPSASEAVPPPETTVAKQGGLFAKIMGKRAAAAPVPPEAPAPEAPAPEAPAPEAPAPEAPAPEAPAPEAPPADAALTDPALTDPALADPALVAAAFGETESKKAWRKKPLPILSIGWGILALIVLIVVCVFMFAPRATVSMLPGAARVYSLFGMPVGASGLAFEGVRYGWTTDGSQTVLEVQGNVRNTSSATMIVPTVVIALRDENGDEISEWTTEVGSAELSAGEQAPFLKQIPSPPSNVRSLKVRFAGEN